MTTNDDDLPEPPIVIETQALAEKISTSVVDYLGSIGWDLAVVSIARRIDVDRGHAVAPGATAMVCDARIRAALDNPAAALRTMAERLAAMAEPAELVSSYVHDKTDHASGGKSWPR